MNAARKGAHTYKKKVAEPALVPEMDVNVGIDASIDE